MTLDRAISGIVGSLPVLWAQLVNLRQAMERTDEAASRMGDVLRRRRSEHQEWFDESGYLREDA